MENHRAHFVAFAEEAEDLVLANLIVVFRGGGPKLDFFQLRAAAALALLVGFFVSLVKILAVVGDLANRRIGGRRNFHQVETFFLGQLYGLKRLHDAELAALIINHPDFASADSLVYANAVGLPEAAFCDKSPSSTSFFAARKRRTCNTFRRQIQGVAPSSQPTPHGAKQPLDGLQSIARGRCCTARGKKIGRASCRE